MVRITIDNRLRIDSKGLSDSLVSELKELGIHRNPKHYALKGMGVRYLTAEPPTYVLAKMKGDELSLPRGTTQQVRAVLGSNSLPIEWEDKRHEGKGPKLEGIALKYELRDYQRTVVDAAFERENCIVNAPTGSGKTIMALALAIRTGLPTVIVVTNRGLAKQWRDEIMSALGIKVQEIGMIGDGVKYIKPITVAMQQTLNRDEDLLEECCEYFGTLIVDEVQLAAAETFTEVVDAFPARYRVGFSADERRKDKKEFLTYDLFGSVAAKVDQDVLIESGAVFDVEIIALETDFRADWYRQQLARKRGRPDFGSLVDKMSTDPHRLSLAMEWVELELNAGRPVVALGHRRDLAYHLVSRVGDKSGLLLGGDGKDEFRRTVKGLANHSITFAAGTYQAFGTGLNIPSLEVGVAMTPLTSNKQLFGQVRGRFCRKSEGKDAAKFYYLWDRWVFGIEPIMNLKRWNNHVTVVKYGTHEKIAVKDYIAEWNREGYGNDNYSTASKGIGFNTFRR